MNGSRKLLIVGGLALAIWGMAYGLFYALFAEHPALDGMGAALSEGFTRAAERKLSEAHAAVERYAQTKFAYVRNVDVHSHWTGLAMLLIVLGMAFDRVAWDDRKRFALASTLVLGSFVFPLGVILQTVDRGLFPQILAAVGAGLVVVALGGVALGLARGAGS